MKNKACLYKHKIKILDKVWLVEYMNYKQFSKLGINNCRAATFPRIKKIVFDCSAVWPGDRVAVHELCHAYAAELQVQDLHFDPRGLEEFFCVMFEMRGDDILKQAKPITKRLMHFWKKQKVMLPEQQEDDECHKQETNS